MSPRLPPSTLTSELTDFFAIAEQLVLSYQIEALYMQALELSATLWTGTLKVELAPDRKELTLDYWT